MIVGIRDNFKYLKLFAINSSPDLLRDLIPEAHRARLELDIYIKPSIPIDGHNTYNRKAELTGTYIRRPNPLFDETKPEVSPRHHRPHKPSHKPSQDRAQKLLAQLRALSKSYSSELLREYFQNLKMPEDGR